MYKTKVFAAATFALLLAAACGTSGSSVGDIFNGGNRAYDITGTVDSVDINNHSILLTNVSGYNTNLAGGSTYGNTVRVYYDNRTTVAYQGRSFRPEDLERGDQVTVHVDDSGNQLMAQSMNVTYDARGGMASSSGGTYPTYNSGSVLTGTVRSIDTNRQTITVDPGYGSYVTVNYGTNTPVYFNGRTYAPRDLEIGDQISVRVNNGGTSSVGAQDITVTRSISGGNNNSNNGTYGTPSTGQFSTVRGTVRFVDTVNRTIQLDSTSWVNGFQTNTGGNTLLIHFDTNARVSVNGQLYPLSNLEAGDMIEVQLEQLGTGNYLAQRINLVRDIRSR
jgi:hypothetical protein